VVFSELWLGRIKGENAKKTTTAGGLRITEFFDAGAVVAGFKVGQGRSNVCP
jgi:hypothetical protein